MLLSDRDIKQALKDKRVVFNPKIEPDQIGPASIDLKLFHEFKVFHTARLSLLDTKKPLPAEFLEPTSRKKNEPFILHPNDFVLASTKEYIKVGDDLVVRVEGKSSLARMGILVHSAGFIDPGFEGMITLEISNQANVAVALYPDMYICQVALHVMSSPAEVPYNKRKKSAYLGQRGPEGASTKNLFDKKQ
ncbi:MAG: dCTP deaminase [Candidatus Spechtbacterales bacterium]